MTAGDTSYQDIVIRTSKADPSSSDRDELISLWNICFDDTPEFVEFFFSKRYVPQNIVCVEYKGHIIAAMHSLPILLKIRGSDVPSTIISGVGTHPDHRGKGLMRRMFDFFIPVLRSRGIWIMTYHPVSFDIYRSMGHLSTSEYILLSYPQFSSNTSQFAGTKATDKSLHESSDKIRISGGHLNELVESELREMHRIYTETTFRYSGMVARTYYHFKLKILDYISSGARYVCVHEQDTLKGYCIYFQSDDKLLAEEMISSTMTEARAITDFIRSLSDGIRTDLKLPPDADIRELISGYEPVYAAFIEQNASGTTDLSSFIRSLDLGRMISRDLLDTFVIDVIDSFCSYNSGCFDLTGKKRSSEGLFSTDIGNFVRFLYGFRTASDLAGSLSPDIRRIADRIDRELGCPVSRIIDEY